MQGYNPDITDSNCNYNQVICMFGQILCEPGHMIIAGCIENKNSNTHLHWR